MRIVIQRVKSASVVVNHSTVGEIDHGLLLFVGIHKTDTKEKIDWCCRKLKKLRIFEDEEGKMNRSVTDVNGGMLVVSQFTLYGNMKKGTRPSFIEAAKPDIAEPLYDYMIEKLQSSFKGPVESGIFGEMMDISLLNDGPVTLIMER
ncbi:D-tyrosyl-tRNA(Tyr) deacylase [soil metagenome]